jgi:hypothetical protein
MAMTGDRISSLESLKKLFGEGGGGEKEIIIPDPAAGHPRVEPISHPANGDEVWFGSNHLEEGEDDWGSSLEVRERGNSR